MFASGTLVATGIDVEAGVAVTTIGVIVGVRVGEAGSRWGKTPINAATIVTAPLIKAKIICGFFNTEVDCGAG